jgi:hypothetical protein
MLIKKIKKQNLLGYFLLQLSKSEIESKSARVCRLNKLNGLWRPAAAASDLSDSCLQCGHGPEEQLWHESIW